MIIDIIYDLYKKEYYDMFLSYKDEKTSNKVLIALSLYMAYRLINIEPNKIKIGDNTLLDEINEYLKIPTKSDLKISNEEKLYDFIHGEDNVSFRKYVPSGEGNTIQD